VTGIAVRNTTTREEKEIACKIPEKRLIVAGATNVGMTVLKDMKREQRVEYITIEAVSKATNG
jgi:hypothetical protein